MPQTVSKLPEYRQGGADNLASLRAYEVASWIETLPLADINETRHLVSTALPTLNDEDVSAQARFEALELFREPVQYLNDALKQPLIGAAFPLTRKASLYASQRYDLHMIMAGGYQSISDELLDLSTLRQDFTLLSTSLQRALHYLGQGLLASYQTYESCGADCWGRIHRIYAAAERKGVQSSVIREPRRHGEKPDATVEEQYKRILLLALANPYRYSQADMARIYSLLEQWSPQCRLYPADHVNELQNAGLVDLASDEGPSYIAYGTVPHPETHRVLDTSTLIHSLLNSIPDDSAQQTLEAGALQTTSMSERELLRSLITAWGMTTKRRFSRIRPETAKLGVSLGLSAVHSLIDKLGSRLPDNAVVPNDRQAAADTQKTVSSGISISIDGETHACEVINESPEGVRLRWHGADRGKIRVGELIAIAHLPESGEMPGIAAIRWLKTTNGNTVEFGVQLLSPDATPITIRLYGAKHHRSKHDYLRGLYIPEFKAARQAASLILPAFLYRSDDIVSLIIDGEEHCLQLQKTVETTQGFSRFHFAAMAVPQDPHESRSDEPRQ
jgi:hypothetical protein